MVKCTNSGAVFSGGDKTVATTRMTAKTAARRRHHDSLRMLRHRTIEGVATFGRVCAVLVFVDLALPS